MIHNVSMIELNFEKIQSNNNYSPYAQLLTPQLLTVFEQSIFENSYASNAKAYFQLLTLF